MSNGLVSPPRLANNGVKGVTKDNNNKRRTILSLQNREYIRHPVRIPIRIQFAGEIRPDIIPGHSANLSQGGVCCLAQQPYEEGDCLRIDIDDVEPPFSCVGRVVWCQPLGQGQYELGVRFFSEQDAYAARMVEQVCHIEDYRRRVLEREGRTMRFDQAASEWIDGFAKDFPSIGDH